MTYFIILHSLSK